MAEHLWGRLAAVSLLVCTLSSGGCADQQKLREEELADLLAWLPGRYDNVAQVERDARAGVHPAHEKIAIIIIPVQTPRLGHHVCYAQEMAADNPRRVMSERMFSFDIDEKRGVIGLMYNFAEPRRWRDGDENPQIFTGVLPQDVAPVGCELIWKRSAEQFTASHDPKHCHRAGGADAGGPEATLTAEALTLSGFEFRKSAH
jgi:CpeT/CpcT family (DUF1001)